MIGCAVVLAVLGSANVCRAQATKTAADHTDSRIDLYGGYGYFHPINSGINGFQYQDVSNPNATVSVTGWFNKYVGLQAEGGYFSGSAEHGIYNSQITPSCSGESCSQLIYTAEGGPVVRYPLGAFVPFIHALGGGVKINGPVAQPLFWGWGVTGGGGLDIVLPFFNHRFAFRAIQADWQYSQVVYGPLVLPQGTHGGFGEIDAMKVSAGLVVRFGDARGPGPVQLGCSVDPGNAYPGDPMKIVGTTLNTDPRRPQTVTWQTNGGKIIGTGLYPALDTTGMKAGEYIIHGHISQGPKARQQADCEAPFSVRAYEPPTITCTATPNVANSGTDIAVSTSGGSPQNRPLTYSYSATEGQITGNGATATLSTAGLSPTSIVITCNVVDDQGQSATATADVKINAPTPPVVISTQQLCSLDFKRDKRRPARVDNEAKGCLDDIALTLNKQTDANLVLVGNFLAPEKEDIAAQRILNARQYLSQEKGIDPSRIELRIGDTPDKTATTTLVPPGAIFNAIGTHTFDASKIVRKGQAYGVPRPPTAAKKGKKPAASDAPLVTPGVAPAAVAPATEPPPAATPVVVSTPAATTEAPSTAPTTPPPTTAPVTTTPAPEAAPASTPPAAATPAPATTTPATPATPPPASPTTAAPTTDPDPPATAPTPVSVPPLP